MTTEQARWDVAAASTIGSFHVREHLPNQDSSEVWLAPDGSAAVAVVADGHGHHAHFRSDVGSSLASAIALDLLRSAVEAGTAVDPASLGAEIAAAWREAVLVHVRAHPLRSDQLRRGPLVPYGSTLVAAAASRGRLVLLQVGDGDAVVVRASGEVTTPLPEDPASSDGVHTASLCQPDPVASLRTADLALDDTDPVTLAFVATDGLGKGRTEPSSWRQDTGREVVATASDEGLDAVRAGLAQLVAGAATAGGDDTTVALVVRTPS